MRQPLLRLKNWRALGDVSHKYQLAANKTFIPAYTDSPGGWHWAAGGLAYLNQDAYIAGGLYISTPPLVPATRAAQFQIAAAPRLESAEETRRGVKNAPSDTNMTLSI